MAAVPMHFYAPDVYEGTSTSNAAVLSTLPKIAGIVMLARIIALAIPPLGSGQTVGPVAETLLLQTWHLIAIVAAVTMTVGNCMALLQNNLRRLLACSSIAHAGYLLVGLAAVTAAAISETRPTWWRINNGKCFDSGWPGFNAFLFGNLCTCNDRVVWWTYLPRASLA